MGQRAQEPPDPSQPARPAPAVETAPPTVPAPSAPDADDLLSQLAGQEIDRLLADADSGAAPAGDQVERATRDVSAQLDDLFAELGRPTPDGKPQPATSTTGPELPDEDLDTALARRADDAIRRTASAPQSPPSAPLPPEHAGQESGAPPTPTAEPHDSPAPTNAERSALADASPLFDEMDDDEPLPLWARPLGWINAPLAGCSPSLRQMLGYVAILTILLSLAVIAYALIFRN